ncbi:MAG: MMPL family transporter [Planctomycetota bacterium]
MTTDTSPSEPNKSWLANWIAFVQSHARATVVTGVVLAVVSLVYTAAKLGFKTDRTDLVSASAEFKRNLDAVTEEFGSDADIIVAVEGSDRTQMISAIETLARDISSYPGHFEKLCYRLKVDKLRAKGLYQLSLDDLKKIEDRIESMGPLLAGTWHWMTVENVLRTARFRLSNLNPQRPIDDKGRQVLESTTKLVESLESYLAQGSVYRSPWQTIFAENSGTSIEKIPDYFFSEDGRIAFLRVIPKTDPTTFTSNGQSIDIIREILHRVEPAYPKLTFGLTGLPILEHDEMLAAQSASTRSLLLSIFGVCLMFMVGFRAFRHPLFAVGSLVMSGCWTMGWVTLTIGHLNILSVSFLVTLVGLGIDYGILWLTRYETNLALGKQDREAGEETARNAGPPILVGALTTALAFYATMLTDFLGLKELGWIAGSGTVLCTIAAMSILPAMLTLWGRRPEVTRIKLTDHLPMFPWLAPHASWVVAGALLLIAWTGWHAKSLWFDYNLLNLQSHGLPAVDWEMRLIEKTGTSAWYALSIADSPDEARRRKKEFEKLSTTGRVIEVASMIPEHQAEKRPIIELIGQSLTRLPTKDRQPNLPAPQLAAIRDLLLELSRNGFRVHAADRQVVDQLAASASSMARVLEGVDPAEAARKLAVYERHWLSDLIAQLWELKSVSNPEPVTLADLPTELVERYHGKSGKWLVQIFAKASVWDVEPLTQFRAEIASVDPNATGKPISTLHSLEQMIDGYKRSTWMAAIIILLAVWLDFRSLCDTLLSCIPLLIGVVMMFGIMGWLDIPLNPANLIALPLILGVGIDCGVHVVHAYREQSGPFELRRQLFRGLSLTGGTTIASFASLMIAQHRGMISIGQVLTIGIASCSVSAIFVLPAVLRLLPERNPATTLSDATASLRLELPSTVEKQVA